MRVCSPNPLTKYLKYLQITYFFHLPQTSYCHTNSQNNFITELCSCCSDDNRASLGLWLPSRLTHISGALVEAVSTVPQWVKAFACHLSFILSSAVHCTNLQMSSCTNSPTLSTPTKQAGLAEPYYLKYFLTNNIVSRFERAFPLNIRVVYLSLPRQTIYKGLNTWLSVTAVV